MWNVSKVLLIAASVLIALGMRVFNSGSTNVESAETYKDSSRNIYIQ